MKKILVAFVIGLMLCTFSPANADLIGIKLTGFPDITFDSTTHFAYDYTGTEVNTLTITAFDEIIKFSTNPSDWTSLVGKVSFSMIIKVG